MVVRHGSWSHVGYLESLKLLCAPLTSALLLGVKERRGPLLHQPQVSRSQMVVVGYCRHNPDLLCWCGLLQPASRLQKFLAEKQAVTSV